MSNDYINQPIFTGRTIVVFNEDVEIEEQNNFIELNTGSRLQSLSSARIASNDEPSGDEGFLLEDIGVAVISEEASRSSDIASKKSEIIQEIVKEEYKFPINYQDNNQRTWGVEAVGATTSPYTGRGIKLAVIDTGLDIGHPDFVNRTDIVAASFVQGHGPEDSRGHGTHCAGTAAGHVTSGGFRYGVAYGATLYTANVFGRNERARDGDIQRAMLWAIASGCEVISMSLGSAVREGQGYFTAYERIGQRALSNGSLIVAAAGNNSDRYRGFIAPVGSPANCPSIMAIASLNSYMGVAYDSCGGINSPGGEINVAAPGVGVISSYPRPRNYVRLSGTSMACPHVAGVAALWAESNSSLRGQSLWNKLEQSARGMHALPRDVGRGLVQAPQSAGA